MAAVYAKADVKRQQINERNRKLRSFAALSLAVLIVAFAAIPISRNLKPGIPEITISETGDELDSFLMPGGEDSRMLALYDAANDNAVVVLKDKEGKKEFYNKIKQDYQISEGEDIPTVIIEESTKTFHSADELAEFLDSLPQDTSALQDAVGDYDEQFFQANDLCAVPMEIAPMTMAEATTEPALVVQDSAAAELTVVSPENQPTTEADASGIELTTTLIELSSAASMAPAATAAPRAASGAYPHPGVYLLLFVPRNK